MILRRRTAMVALATSGFASAWAVTFPSRPLRLIVPFAPGSPTDTLARAFAEGLATDLGQPVVVDNRPGAGGNIGASLAAKAAPDGSTLYFATSAHAISASLYRKLPYDSVGDFTGVSQVAVFRFTLVAHPRLEARDLKTFIAILRAKQGQYSYGSSGNGSALHLATELFNETAGVASVHVPFKGANEVLSALLTGPVDYDFLSLQAALPYMDVGTLRGFGNRGAQAELAGPRLTDLCGGWNATV